MDQKQYEYNAGRVSIVTPVYNGETHLAKMLDSVLAQTYPDVEMILVDDGSADGTVRAAQNYSEKFEEKGYGYRIVRAEHKNASAAINRGLPFVSGEYLIWPDSDDYLEPESIRRRVDFLRQHPQYACVRSLSYYFDEETGTRSEKADEQRGDLKKLDLFWDILESKTFVCCGCYMLRTKAFFEVYPKRRIPEYDVGQNFQMLLPFLYRHKCSTIQEELYGVCVRAGSHSRIELLQEQEENRYANYERMVDELAALCPLKSREELDRITRWKAARRYHISLKYGRWREALLALNRLRSCGGLRGSRTLEAVKELIWALCRNTWLWKKLYPPYRRFFHSRQ